MGGPVVKMSRRLCLLALAGSLATSASCYSWQSTRIEFDSVAGYVEEEAKEPDELTWRSTAQRYPWVFRQFESGFLSGLVELTGVRRGPVAVSNPAGFAGDRILWLAELAGTDLLKIGDSVWRLLLVLDRDPSTLHRIYAVQGLRRLIETFSEQDLGSEEGRLVDPEHSGLQVGDVGAYRIAARELTEKLEGAWVGRRSDPLLAQGGREDFAQAMDALAQLAPGDLQQERIRLRLFVEAVRVEPYRPLQERLATSMIRCVQSACVRGLRHALTDPDGHVRVAALENLVALGGRRLLPCLLGILENRPEVLADPGLRADPDPLVRRELVLWYWSGDASLAEERHGRGRSGFAFLHELASSDPEDSLRILAADALAGLIGHPTDPFGEWIPDWWRGYLEKQRTESGNTNEGTRGS